MAGNPYFQFKEFTVYQDKCAMKVCTDACAFGAVVNIIEAHNILDIGAGTGLLSMMVAQRNKKAVVDAVEIDHDACEQAVQNVADSPFSERIRIFQTAIQDFVPGVQYDAIISNPPFFQRDLRSPTERKNVAHHAEALTFDQLLTDASRLLAPGGSFHVLLPTDESLIFQEKAEKEGWKLTSETLLKHNSTKKPFRRIMTFKFGYIFDIQLDSFVLEVYSEDGKKHSDQFIELLKPFYMIF